MATLNSTLTNITTGTEVEIGQINSSQGKISEVIVSNMTTNGSTDADNNITYQLIVTSGNTNYPITPVTRLLKNETHIIPMSTFISHTDKVKISIPNGKKVDTVVSIIEL